eukprot:gene2343-2811_t
MSSSVFVVETNWKTENSKAEEIYEFIKIDEKEQKPNNILSLKEDKERCKIILTLKESKTSFFQVDCIKIYSNSKTIEIYSGDDEYVETKKAHEIEAETKLFVTEFSKITKPFKKITFKFFSIQGKIEFLLGGIFLEGKMIEDTVKKHIPRKLENNDFDMKNIQSMLSNLNIQNVSTSSLSDPMTKSLLTSLMNPKDVNNSMDKVATPKLNENQMNEIKNYIDSKFEDMKKYVDEKIDKNFKTINK